MKGVLGNPNSVQCFAVKRRDDTTHHPPQDTQSQGQLMMNMKYVLTVKGSDQAVVGCAKRAVAFDS